MTDDEDDPIAVFVSERAPGWEWQAFSTDRETPETVYYGRVRSPLTRGDWEWGTFSESDLESVGAQEVDDR
ncbi:hypothetical protein [Halococcus salifodinae]|uniref:Uncharacterized protein n=1 Tax=Halococcus salifodinae DSM 8989 TaxID=1227456 RepID=M0MQZ9_9EURY|nr:hypothetical protein [Halococcus salifodinae]EMA47783.1 hypothetical protein C450_20731 [Halococcus salifodinae DSM 8989]